MYEEWGGGGGGAGRGFTAYDQRQISTVVVSLIMLCHPLQDSDEPDAKRQRTAKPIAEIMAPSIVKVVEFAKRIPGFKEVSTDFQVLQVTFSGNSL